MKVYCVNYNGILDGLIDCLRATDQLTDSYHAADVFILWNDVRGDMAQLANIARHQLGKPVIVVQHGRGATRDYGPPNNFTMQADKILVWGESERERLLRYGCEDSRIAVVGCPLFERLAGRKALSRRGKNILFVPIIAEKEEPENIIAYSYLKEWESRQLRRGIFERFKELKRGWAFENHEVRRVEKADRTFEDITWRKEVIPKLPRDFTYLNGLLNVKLTGVHDVQQYMSPCAFSNQNDPDHVESIIELLANTDAMVCLEEGTMQLAACAMDIPIILVDTFKYGTYGGSADYDKVEKIATNAVYRTKNYEKIPALLDHALACPGELRRARIAVCEREGSADKGGFTERVMREIEALAGVPA